MKRNTSTTNSVKWNGINSIVSQVPTFITGVLLMRLLDPSAFGLIGMITVFTGFLNTLRNSGLGSSLIFKSGLTKTDKDTVFWFNFTFGIVIAVIIFFSSGLMADYYEEPQLNNLAKVFSLTFIISALSGVHGSLLKKNLEFKKIFQANIIALVVSNTLTIIAAFNGYGVWSLIVLNLSSSIISTVNLYFVSDYRPSTNFSWSVLKSHFDYSFPVLGTKSFNYWTRNADNFFIGSFLGSQALGYYSRAYFFVTMPTKNISSIIGNILFPSLSLVRKDKKRAADLYLKSMRMTSIITFPLMGGLLVLTQPFVLVTFGTEWLPIVVTLKIMCVLSLFESVFVFTNDIFFAQGATKLNFKISMIYGFCNIIAFYVGSLYSIEMVAILLLSIFLIYLVPKIYYGCRLIDLKVSAVFSNLAGIFIINLACMALTYSIIFFFDSNVSHTLILVIGIVSYLLLFIILNLAYNKIKFIEFITYFLIVLRE